MKRALIIAAMLLAACGEEKPSCEEATQAMADAMPETINWTDAQQAEVDRAELVAVEACE